MGFRAWAPPQRGVKAAKPENGFAAFFASTALPPGIAGPVRKSNTERSAGMLFKKMSVPPRPPAKAPEDTDGKRLCRNRAAADSDPAGGPRSPQAMPGRPPFSGPVIVWTGRRAPAACSAAAGYPRQRRSPSRHCPQALQSPYGNLLNFHNHIAGHPSLQETEAKKSTESGDNAGLGRQSLGK